jgi:uncharacterized protein (TIGR02466 family)
MREPVFELLFPTPVMTSSIDRDFTPTELEYLNSHKDATFQNEGNTTSLDNYILDNPELSDLKNIMLDHVKVYINKVYKPRHPVEPCITQSWLNWTNTGQYHHIHEHPNSFISGVLYINASTPEDKIKFHKNQYQQIKLESDNHDIFNSTSWWLNVRSCDVIIFPSSLSHNVDRVTSNETRISLAFNTFLKGIIGDNRALTELKNDL